MTDTVRFVAGARVARWSAKPIVGGMAARAVVRRFVAGPREEGTMGIENTSLHVDPRRVEMVEGQIATFVIDAAARLATGEFVAGITAKLVDVKTDTDVAGTAIVSSTHDGSTVTLVIGGLVADHRYRLTVFATVSAAKVEPLLLTIDCVA